MRAKKSIAVIRRRLDYLLDSLKEEPEDKPWHHVRAEVAALTTALNVLCERLSIDGNRDFKDHNCQGACADEVQRTVS